MKPHQILQELEKLYDVQISDGPFGVWNVGLSNKREGPVSQIESRFLHVADFRGHTEEEAVLLAARFCGIDDVPDGRDDKIKKLEAAIEQKEQEIQVLIRRIPEDPPKKPKLIKTRGRPK